MNIWCLSNTLFLFGNGTNERIHCEDKEETTHKGST
jgi:hypothetical protein